MTKIRWDSGTAYDLFISLLVLHHAAEFGLRPSWTAGVRQRLSAPRRDFLERVSSFSSVPLTWISNLPGSKDASDILSTAADLAPADCMFVLTLPADTPVDARQALDRIASRGSVTAAEKEYLGLNLVQRDNRLKPAGLENLLQVWKSAERSKKLLLEALQEYYTAFFKDEETRIRPALEAGLERGRELAGRVAISALVEDLSRGVHFAEVETVKELVLAPSYWSTPFVFHVYPGGEKSLIVFGCRPGIQSVAPGADTPDLLVNALKSLADPTRLRILQYLAQRPLTPTELARLLRLRPPTVLHHLQALRLAGLVAIRVSETNEKRYAARLETLNSIFTSVNDFLKKD
jgi:DNA-binding transcriptional ArsR family regulator